MYMPNNGEDQMMDSERLKLARQALGIGTAAEASTNLLGAILDIQRAHGVADAVCQHTLDRVLKQPQAAKALLSTQ
jgi:hypothetical protein